MVAERLPLFVLLPLLMLGYLVMQVFAGVLVLSDWD